VGAAYLEWIGSATSSYRFTPWDLVISTAPQLSSLDPEIAGPNPVRISILSKQAGAYDLGVRDADYIVRRPVHPTALRLLIERLLYSGPERRTSRRVAVGVPVQFRTGMRRRPATMIDLSTEGCRLLSDHSAPFGGKLTVYFPRELDDGKTFSVQGRVMRSETGEEEQAGAEIISVRFDETSATVIDQLRNVVELHVQGPAIFDGAEAFRRQIEPGEAQPARGEESADELIDKCRIDTRVAFTRRVISLGEGPAHVLLGRDLSIGGMWVEPNPWLAIGHEMRLAVHARAGQDPLVVEARVDRGDSSAGFALLFQNMPGPTLDQLTTMLDDLPEIDTVGEGNNRVIVTSIVEDDNA